MNREALKPPPPIPPLNVAGDVTIPSSSLHHRAEALYTTHIRHDELNSLTTTTKRSEIPMCCSGGGSNNGRPMLQLLAHCTGSSQGRRSKQEDSVCCHEIRIAGGATLLLGGVFDGHGGHEVSTIASAQIEHEVVRAFSEKAPPFGTGDESCDKNTDIIRMGERLSRAVLALDLAIFRDGAQRYEAWRKRLSSNDESSSRPAKARHGRGRSVETEGGRCTPSPPSSSQRPALEARGDSETKRSGCGALRSLFGEMSDDEEDEKEEGMPSNNKSAADNVRINSPQLLSPPCANIPLCSPNFHEPRPRLKNFHFHTPFQTRRDEQNPCDLPSNSKSEILALNGINNDTSMKVSQCESDTPRADPLTLKLASSGEETNETDDNATYEFARSDLPFNPMPQLVKNSTLRTFENPERLPKGFAGLGSLTSPLTFRPPNPQQAASLSNRNLFSPTQKAATLTFQGNCSKHFVDRNLTLSTSRIPQVCDATSESLSRACSPMPVHPQPKTVFDHVGTTASITLFSHSFIVNATLGDSRSVLFRIRRPFETKVDSTPHSHCEHSHWQVVFKSEEHRLSSDVEKRRIDAYSRSADLSRFAAAHLCPTTSSASVGWECAPCALEGIQSASSSVADGSTPFPLLVVDGRLLGRLNVSRGLGDFSLKYIPENLRSVDDAAEVFGVSGPTASSADGHAMNANPNTCIGPMGNWPDVCAYAPPAAHQGDSEEAMANGPSLLISLSASDGLWDVLGGDEKDIETLFEFLSSHRVFRRSVNKALLGSSEASNEESEKEKSQLDGGEECPTPRSGGALQKVVDDMIQWAIHEKNSSDNVSAVFIAMLEA